MLTLKVFTLITNLCGALTSISDNLISSLLWWMYKQILVTLSHSRVLELRLCLKGRISSHTSAEDSQFSTALAAGLAWPKARLHALAFTEFSDNVGKAFITWEPWAFLSFLWLPGIGTLVLWAGVLKLGERQVVSDLSTDSYFLPSVFFCFFFSQLYHTDSFVSPLIFKLHLKYSGQEQSELYRLWWTNEKSTHKSRRLFTQKGKNRNQIWGLTYAIVAIGTACIGSKASGPWGGVAKQSDISSQYF